jgi:hypothetical protein
MRLSLSTIGCRGRLLPRIGYCGRLLLIATIPALAAPLQYTLNPSVRFQRIEGFGASDCWTVQYAGLLPDARREQLAEWLFSTRLDEHGRPGGIGLTLWRFNIGAGSADQGDAGKIRNPMRRTECFLRPDGGYDWSRQAGQRWFLRAAQERGVAGFIAFCNSPPVSMTKNGLANSFGRGSDRSCNLREERYADFAEFLAVVLDGVHRREGILFDHISPFNEPEWEWREPTQEGTPASNGEIAAVVRELDRALVRKGVQTRISVSDSGAINYLYESVPAAPEKDNKIEAFFDPESPDYIGNLARVERCIDAHSYWTTTPASVLKSTRAALRAKLDEYRLEYRQSELCIMQNDKPVGGGHGRDLTMKTALYVAGIIHHDLCVANAISWCWWLAVSDSDYKDGLLYADFNAARDDARITDSRLLWTLGNYARFVRPGSRRVEVRGDSADADDLEGVMVSAYLNARERVLVCVWINTLTQDQPVRLRVAAADSLLSKGVFVTSDRAGDTLRHYKELNPLEGCALPARSVSTWIARW